MHATMMNARGTATAGSEIESVGFDLPWLGDEICAKEVRWVVWHAVSELVLSVSFTLTP